MHILLTDVLVCPRCGPGFGLILLANEMADRRVLRGWLGCSNCRERNEVRDGVVVMTGDGAHPGEGEGALGPAMNPVKIAALLGVTGPAYVLLLGDAVGVAGAIAELVEDVEVIALLDPGAAVSALASTAGGREWGVSGVIVEGGGAGGRIPVATGKMSGVALLGGRADALLEEGARVVRPTGRLLVDPSPAGARDRLAKLGLRVLAEEGSTLLAVRG